jgi:hypothetical protein
MLKHVGELTRRAYALRNDFYVLMPEKYRDDRSYSRDAVREAWQNAMTALASGWRQLNDLRSVLKEKAGIIVEKDELIEIDSESKTLADWAAEYDIPEHVILDRVRCGADWEWAVTYVIGRIKCSQWWAE